MATAKERREAAKERENDLQRQLQESERKIKQLEDDAAKGKITPSSEQIAALNKETTIHPDQVPNAHGAPIETKVSGEKCFVGLKIGIAYLDLQLSKLEEKDELTQTGSRRIKEAVRVGPVVRLRGTAYPRGTPPEGFPERPMIVNGAAINPNVDKDFMRAWLEQNATNAMVTNRMIFIGDKESDVIAMAREMTGAMSGFEPINPKGDPRSPKSANKDVAEIQSAKEPAKA